jgi:hypothetical protein
MEPIIKYQGTLKNLKLENVLIQHIKQELQESFPQIENVKLNLDLVRQICKAIETNCKVNHLEKVDKLELFFKIYEITFGRLDERDKQYLSSMINYLHKNNMIKARSLTTRIIRMVKNYFLKH